MFVEKSLVARADATTAQRRDLIMDNKPRSRWTIGMTITAYLMYLAERKYGTLR